MSFSVSYLLPPALASPTDTAWLQNCPRCLTYISFPCCSHSSARSRSLERFLPCPLGERVLRPCSCPPLPTSSPRAHFRSLHFGGSGGRGTFFSAFILLGLFKRSSVLCPRQVQLRPACRVGHSYPPCLQVMLSAHKVNPRRAFASRVQATRRWTQACGLLAPGPESSCGPAQLGFGEHFLSTVTDLVVPSLGYRDHLTVELCSLLGPERTLPDRKQPALRSFLASCGV